MKINIGDYIYKCKVNNIEMVKHEVGDEPGGVVWLLVNGKEVKVTIHEYGDLDFVGWDDLSDDEQDDVYRFIFNLIHNS